MLYKNILETIGKTPLVRINKIAKNINAEFYAKIESANPGNSIKDRIGIKMIEDAEKAGKIVPGGTIIEGTSGNTGMGLALACIMKGYKLICTTTDKQSKEKMDMLRAVGAEVIVCPTNVEPEDARSYYSVAKRLSKEIPNSFYPNQYDNLSNRQAHYETTGPEIWNDTDGKVKHIVCGVGTGGTISGIAKYLKEKNPDIKIWGIDTYGSVFKKYHETGEFDTKEIYPYITEGIGEDILPGNVDFTLIDRFEKVTDREAFLMTRRIAREEGILAGNSSGSALAGALQLKDEYKEGDIVVVIFPDHASRYVGKVFNDDWMRERGFLDSRPNTAKDILQYKGIGELISLNKGETVQHAVTVMREQEIDQVVVTENGEIIGSLSESRLYAKLLENPENKHQPIEKLMEKPFPIVDSYTSYPEISAMINRENPAVLVKMPSGELQIITKYDIIHALAG
jgi:cystathionine beta-synthase